MRHQPRFQLRRSPLPITPQNPGPVQGTHVSVPPLPHRLRAAQSVLTAHQPPTGQTLPGAVLEPV
jgi:hypothetical protein